MPSAPSKRSGGLFLADPAKKSKSSPQTRSGKSVWNSTDDWTTLVAESSLSTSSVSTRPPRPRGRYSLVRLATDAAAKGFRRLWEDDEKGWKVAWARTPDHLKIGVRDATFLKWGGYLYVTMIQERFLIPPSLYLPGTLLHYFYRMASRPIRPPDSMLPLITTLVLTHFPTFSDADIAGLVGQLQNLEVINLKGCTLAGSKTMNAILTRCPKLREVNLKGTHVNEGDLRRLLDVCGKHLEALKVEEMSFESIENTFASEPFPALTQLCLPGYFINAGSAHSRSSANGYRQIIAHPNVRPAASYLRINWHRFGAIFPSLTHLSLPGLLLPHQASITLAANTLVKLSIGPGGPPVPMRPLIDLIASQSKSLEVLHLGHLLPGALGVEALFTVLGKRLEQCEGLQDFSLKIDSGGSRDARCDQAMAKFSDRVYVDALRGPWRRSLRRLSLVLPQAIKSESFLSNDQAILDRSVEEDCPRLESLELPGADIKDTAAFAEAIAGFTGLRSLDVSGTVITDEDIFAVLDECHALSRVDLTSCRGVNVRHRRNIFQAWQDTRMNEARQSSVEGDDSAHEA